MFGIGEILGVLGLKLADIQKQVIKTKHIKRVIFIFIKYGRVVNFYCINDFNHLPCGVTDYVTISDEFMPIINYACNPVNSPTKYIMLEVVGNKVRFHNYDGEITGLHNGWFCGTYISAY